MSWCAVTPATASQQATARHGVPSTADARIRPAPTNSSSHSPSNDARSRFHEQALRNLHADTTHTPKHTRRGELTTNRTTSSSGGVETYPRVRCR